MPDYPPEQLWPLYEKLPENLKEAIFSEKVADIIYDVGNRNGLEEKEISELAKYIGYVMLGLLPPEEFQRTLKEELELEDELAKKVALEITGFVFLPIKEELEILYKIKIEPVKPPMPSIKPEVSLAPEIKPSVEEKPKEIKRDIYREPIE
jgi:hypothetical protein